MLLDIINTSDGQLFLTRRAPALRARLYITPKSISYTDTDTHIHRHRHTQTHTNTHREVLKFVKHKQGRTQGSTDANGLIIMM